MAFRESARAGSSGARLLTRCSKIIFFIKIFLLGGYTCTSVLMDAKETLACHVSVTQISFQDRMVK